MTRAMFALLEAVARSPQARLERRMAVAVGRIFRRQGRAFPAQTVAEWGIAMAPRRVDEVAVPRNDDAYLWRVYESWPAEDEALSNVIALFGGRAQLAGTNYTLARLGFPRASSLLPVAAERMAENALQHATGIEQVSMERIRDRLVEGLRAGKDARAIARDLRAEFEGWSRPSARGRLTAAERAIVTRADMIARTEVAEAFESASYDVMVAHGVSGRRWVTAEDERVDHDGVSGPCIDNEAAGVVPIGDAFPSGHMWPPAHPNCRCVTVEAWQ